MDENALLSTPEVGAAGATGGWRYSRPVIDHEKCTKCLRCWAFCPESCVERAPDDSVKIVYEYCKGCGVCEVECTPKAIKMAGEQ